MNYRVLYRKYRPENFDTLIGQENVSTILRDSIINEKISHAYIFSGPRGTGKTSTAKIFGKAINCLNPENGNPCGKCVNCINFKQSNDIYEIDAASNTGVDQIREIIDNIKLTPISSKYKVYIIDEVHMLSTNAFNALLLTLEEPPGHVVFILATTDIQEVPITVLSRCQRLDFKRISTELIEKHIIDVSKRENIKITSDAAHEIAEYSDGGMRDALSILDQLSKEAEEISLDKVLSNIGLVSSKQIQELIDSINNNCVEDVEFFVSNAKSKALDFKTIIKKLITEIKKRSLKAINKYSSDRLTFKDYKQLCFELSECLTRVNVNIDSYDLLEMTLLDYVNQNTENNGKIISREIISDKNEPINNDLNDKNISREIISGPNDTISNDFNNKNISREIIFKSNNIENKNILNNEVSKIRVNNCFCAAKKDILKIVSMSWVDFLKNGCSKKIKGYISDTSIVLASNEYLVIKTDFKESANNINDTINSIENEYNQWNQSNYKLVAISSDDWSKEIEKYKDNLKNNIKYAYIPENENDSSNIDNIFQETNIEIK